MIREEVRKQYQEETNRRKMENLQRGNMRYGQTGMWNKKNQEKLQKNRMVK